MKRVKVWLGIIGLALVSNVQASERAGYFGLMGADTYVGLGVAQQTIKLNGYKDTDVPGLVLTLGTQVSSWVDAEFRLSTNNQRIELEEKNSTNQTQFDDFYDVSGLFKFKLQGQAAAKNAHIHAILGYNFSQYKTRELTGNLVTSEVNKQTNDGLIYGVGASLKLTPKHALDVRYLALQSRESFDNSDQLKRDSIGISWLYYY